MVDNEADQKLNATFHALADPTRRRVLALLREAGELRVSDIAQVFDMSLNGVSKHLKVLERAGLLRRRITGRTHHLSVEWSALRSAAEWLDFHHHFWATRLDALADHLAGHAAESSDNAETTTNREERNDD